MIKGKEGLVSVNIEDVSKTEWWAEVHLVSSEVGQQVCVCVCVCGPKSVITSYTTQS